jgi:hypothetical protein
LDAIETLPGDKIRGISIHLFQGKRAFIVVAILGIDLVSNQMPRVDELEPQSDEM